jgi:hypothetical protein
MFNKTRVFSLISLLFLTSFVVSLLVSAQSKRDDTVQTKKTIQTAISYCNLEVPAFWKQANSNFYLMYSFKLNDKGESAEIKKIRDDVIGEEKVKQCVADWKISGLPENTELVVSFKWQHGKGWVEQTIFGKGFKQTNNIENVGY